MGIEALCRNKRREVIELVLGRCPRARMNSGEADSANAAEARETRGKLVLIAVLRDAVEVAEGFTVTNREELSVIP